MFSAWPYKVHTVTGLKIFTFAFIILDNFKMLPNYLLQMSNDMFHTLHHSNPAAKNLQRTTNQEKYDQCGNSTE